MSQPSDRFAAATEKWANESTGCRRNGSSRFEVPFRIGAGVSLRFFTGFLGLEVHGHGFPYTPSVPSGGEPEGRGAGLGVDVQLEVLDPSSSCGSDRPGSNIQVGLPKATLPECWVPQQEDTPTDTRAGFLCHSVTQKSLGHQRTRSPRFPELGVS